MSTGSEVTKPHSLSRKDISLLMKLRLGHEVLVMSLGCIDPGALMILGPDSLSVLVLAVSFHMVSSHALSTIGMMTLTTDSHVFVPKGRENWSLSQSPYCKSQKILVSSAEITGSWDLLISGAHHVGGVFERKHPDKLELWRDSFLSRESLMGKSQCPPWRVIPQAEINLSLLGETT